MDKEWSEKNKQMQSLLNKKDTFKEAIDILIELNLVTLTNLYQ